jgi:hypothetical protein
LGFVVISFRAFLERSPRVAEDGTAVTSRPAVLGWVYERKSPRRHCAIQLPAPITASMEYPNWEGDSAEYSSADVICPGGRVIGESGSFASVDEWKARIEEETIRAA